MNNKYIFIIDTDSYAGNFERDMCAYITGVVGGCEVGEEFAAMYDKEVNTDGKESVFLEYLDFRSDEHGCARPCECWPTKGWLSVGGHKAVRDEDWNQEDADKVYQTNTAEIYRGYLKQVERVVIGEGGWTTASKATAIKRHEKDIERALKEKSPKNMPNNSVAIFFDKKPTSEMIVLIKNRVRKFAEAKRQYVEKENISYEKNFKLTIHGFRMVKETTVWEDVAI
jgi:hypothetical protein